MDAHTALAWLDDRAGYERTGVVTEPSTARAEALAQALGDPQRSYRVVHLTGTNGKGSTSAMVTGLLTASGLRVGTFTSPHLHAVNERIAVDGVPISDDDLAAVIADVAVACAEVAPEASFFEVVTAAALAHFARAEVDVAVIEVGMLGRWDATNVVSAEVAVVTNVELDHEVFAGGGRDAIAKEKAGIVEEGCTLVLGVTDPHLAESFVAEGPGTVHQRGVDLSWTDRSPGPGGQSLTATTPTGGTRRVRLRAPGAHQADNAVLALCAAESILGRAMDPDVVDAVLSTVVVGARTEVVSTDPLVVVDGAHNTAGAAAAGRCLRDDLTAPPPWVVVLGCTRDRDPADVLAALEVPAGTHVVATTTPSQRTHPAQVVADAGAAAGLGVSLLPDPAAAVAEAVAIGRRVGGTTLVIGSLYLAAVARDVLGAAGGPTTAGGPTPPAP